jgi:hypothetical protein
MFRLFKKRREAVKKYLLIFFLGIVSVGMVATINATTCRICIWRTSTAGPRAAAPPTG